MTLGSILSLVLGLLLSLILQLYTYFCIVLIYSDPTTDKNPLWLSMPLILFLAVCYFVYWCYSTEEMEQTYILGCTIRLRALKLTVISEVWIAVAICIVLCLVTVVGTRLAKQAQQSNKSNQSLETNHGQR
jgi:hypothetical protein